VGEILAAIPLARQLRQRLPQAGLIVSTGTETGQSLARQHFSPLGAWVCYFPLDVPWAVHRLLNYVKPDAFVSLESEIWPNFLTAAHRRGVRLALVNARLSDRSFIRFLKFRRHLIDIINQYDVIAAGSSGDLARFQALGVAGDKLHLGGNLKFDRLFQEKDWQKLANFRAMLFGDASDAAAPPVLLAASTHPGEDEAVLAAFRQLQAPYPALLLILAPRHPSRIGAVQRLLSSQGLSHHLFSRLKAGQETRRRPVALIDTIGDLFTLYGLADAAFVGGSLIPHGGQNILEPAAWGLSPLYGPHIDNFRWAKAVLDEAGAGRQVQDAASLAAAVKEMLDQPEARQAEGQRALAALQPHQGAARRQADLIVRMLGEKIEARAGGF
jgi:3-deoxy-D-manno-octulosonic-acid transferase